MKKLLLLILISFSFFQFSALAQRAPAVDPVTEIATDDLRHPAPADAVGFNFSQESNTASTVVTMLFLLGLPLMIWLSISKGLTRRTKKKDEVIHDNVTQFPTRNKEEDKTDYKKAS